MASVPLYLQARNLVSVAVYFGDADATGAITWGTAVDLAVAATGGTGTKTFEEFSWTANSVREAIKPADGTIANNVIEYDDWSANIREIAVAGGLGAVAAIANGHDYIKVVATYRPRGASSGGTTVAVIGLRGDFTAQIAAGKNVWSLSIVPIGYALYMGPVGSIPTF